MEHCGAFGFRLDPHLFGRRYLHTAAPDWPALEVRVGDPPEGWREVFAGDGWAVRVRRGGEAVWWTGGAVHRPDSRVHPMLSLVVCAATLERGGDCLHAGAVHTPDGVVAVLAPSGGGKTSTMAYLAFEAGLDVLTDDHLNLRDGVAHAGPGCLDLRPDAAARLGFASAPGGDFADLAVVAATNQARTGYAGHHNCKIAVRGPGAVRGPEAGGEVVRGGERVRLELPAPRTLAAPVVRTVVLEWGDSERVDPVPPRERLALLCAARTAPLVPGGLAVPLALAALPMHRVTRRRTFGTLPWTARAVLTGSTVERPWWSAAGT
ncbi:hypothetical protein Val02_71780 [Virgisporangium aliadipatigenens]|uniref:Uncharacterized protein n=1 Tax=Virgisporangium aliadipatigenens TaxID=741659 RepID=A0A8J4DVN1_9ACTN|nr:hypothetical protein [Virgisporangium aliadipatigenens]GIJ50292.1 hypothetical protein Val02_71780 [Virgisporangium aliadipatigenens]